MNSLNGGIFLQEAATSLSSWVSCVWRARVRCSTAQMAAVFGMLTQRHAKKAFVWEGRGCCAFAIP